MASALLVVDVQNDFLPGGALPTIERGVVRAINALLATDNFGVTVASQDWHPEDHISFAARHGKPAGDILKLYDRDHTLFNAHCVQNTKGAEFATQLTTTRLDKVVQKGTDQDEECFSAFHSFCKRSDTGLTTWLRQHNINHVYVAGVALETCVKCSVEDSIQAGFATSLVSDACAPADADAEPGVLKGMEAAGCRIITAAELVGGSV